MMAQAEFKIPMYIQNGCFLMSPLYAWIFIDVLQWKIGGAAMVRNCCEMSALVVIVYVLRYKKTYPKTMIPFHPDSLKNWGEYLKVSVPIGAMVYLQWTFFEIQTILVSIVNNTKAMAAHSSFVGIILTFYMIPMGMSWSVNSIMGSMVGAGNVEIAKNF